MVFVRDIRASCSFLRIIRHPFRSNFCILLFYSRRKLSTYLFLFHFIIFFSRHFGFSRRYCHLAANFLNTWWNLKKIALCCLAEVFDVLEVVYVLYTSLLRIKQEAPLDMKIAGLDELRASGRSCNYHAPMFRRTQKNWRTRSFF